ncbi:NAD(P)-binding domain-containing protein [Paenibacillus paeoniae]|uniref:NAD(P)/FAD-dependent oxidoreductase n=1 Tax=Paenibacillus paeoniae TaxID=2292705 RepID=A0A371PKX5_9BACL|nr:NAD(P)-binding domain-containing protein [Paenibacillus paeoniae]REK76854.1 NAD(P)/FAD-dependent oxidoreductase [Paenibacillus paeoniae]
MSQCCSTPQPIQETLKASTAVSSNPDLPVAIIGGGPVGLAAAAHLVTKGESFILFEAAPHIAGNVNQWDHIRVFSPWQYNMNKAAKQLLEASGWKSPDEQAFPTGRELIDEYLAPLSQLPVIKPFVHYNAKVVAVTRKGLSKVKTAGRDKRPFELHVQEENQTIKYKAKAVIDASGTWSSPNPAVSDGVWTIEERSLSSQITYGIPDVLGKEKERFAGKNILVVGSGHSAINALLDLERLKEQDPLTSISWVIRKSNVKDVYGGQENDELRERGTLGVRLQQLVESGKVTVYPSFLIERFEKNGVQINISGTVNGETVYIHELDQIISNTGSRPDLSFLREVRTDIDSAIESVGALAPLIDPNEHSCGTVRPHGEKELRQPEHHFYIVGSKSYGRAPTFLMTTGYEQVRSIVEGITGNWEAAANVELDLPETGVCSISQSVQFSNNCSDAEPADNQTKGSCSTAPDVNKTSCSG